MITWATSISPTFLVFVIIVLAALLLASVCLLVISNAREKAQDADYESLETQYELAQMKIRELQRDARIARSNPS